MVKHKCSSRNCNCVYMKKKTKHFSVWPLAHSFHDHGKSQMTGEHCLIEKHLVDGHAAQIPWRLHEVVSSAAGSSQTWQRNSSKDTAGRLYWMLAYTYSTGPPTSTFCGGSVEDTQCIVPSPMQYYSHELVEEKVLWFKWIRLVCVLLFHCTGYML